MSKQPELNYRTTGTAMLVDGINTKQKCSVHWERNGSHATLNCGDGNVCLTPNQLEQFLLIGQAIADDIRGPIAVGNPNLQPIAYGVPR